MGINQWLDAEDQETTVDIEYGGSEYVQNAIYDGWNVR